MDLFTQPWADSGCLDSHGVATLRCIWPLMNNIINAAIMLSGIAALFFLMWGGVKYITSRGDSAAVESAQKTITFAIIGLVVVILSFAIFNFVLGFLGINPNDIYNAGVTPTP